MRGHWCAAYGYRLYPGALHPLCPLAFYCSRGGSQVSEFSRRDGAGVMCCSTPRIRSLTLPKLPRLNRTTPGKFLPRVFHSRTRRGKSRRSSVRMTRPWAAAHSIITSSGALCNPASRTVDASWPPATKDEAINGARCSSKISRQLIGPDKAPLQPLAPPVGLPPTPAQFPSCGCGSSAAPL